MKTFYKKWWFWLIIVAVLIAAANGNSDARNWSIDKNDTTVMTNNDTDILHIDGHPVLYDDGAKSRKFAAEHKGIETEYKNYKRGETVISLRIYGQTGKQADSILHEIELYPQQDLDLNETMQLAKEYLPMDIIKEHYAQEWSKRYCQQDDGARLYAQLYKPIDRQSEWFKNNEINYNYVLIFTKIASDKAEYLVLRTTNSMPNTGRNCEIEQWDYSII